VLRETAEAEPCGEEAVSTKKEKKRSRRRGLCPATTLQSSQTTSGAGDAVERRKMKVGEKGANGGWVAPEPRARLFMGAVSVGRAD